MLAIGQFAAGGGATTVGWGGTDPGPIAVSIAQALNLPNPRTGGPPFAGQPSPSFVPGGAGNAVLTISNDPSLAGGKLISTIPLTPELARQLYGGEEPPPPIDTGGVFEIPRQSPVDVRRSRRYPSPPDETPGPPDIGYARFPGFQFITPLTLFEPYIGLQRRRRLPGGPIIPGPQPGPSPGPITIPGPQPGPSPGPIMIPGPQPGLTRQVQIYPQGGTQREIRTDQRIKEMARPRPQFVDEYVHFRQTDPPEPSDPYLHLSGLPSGDPLGVGSSQPEATETITCPHCGGEREITAPIQRFEPVKHIPGLPDTCSTCSRSS